MHGKASLAAALAVLVASGTFAATPPNYLTPSQYDPAQLLPPPPLDDSIAAKSELAELKRIENRRSAAQLASAKSDDKTENVSIFAKIMGPGFDLKPFPPTQKMIIQTQQT